MRCFACHAEIDRASGERIGFRDACDGCGADLHVCRNCGHFDPSAYNQCREPQTESVGDRERANRCEWFRPDPRDGRATAEPRQAARAALERLFGKGKT